jgi:hypothetical protein
MTAVTGCNIRNDAAYWVLSGPTVLNATKTCRACKQSILPGEDVMARDGRKLRFFYHLVCFSGGADPRSQENSTFEMKTEYHKKWAPNLSSLEGPRAVKDGDGREMGRTVFKDKAPSVVGAGKWSVQSRGFVPIGTTKALPRLAAAAAATASSSSSISSSVARFPPPKRSCISKLSSLKETIKSTSSSSSSSDK